MAQNIEGLSIRRQDEALAVGDVASGDYTGTFTGPLHGNADTASSLAAPFTVTFTGDAGDRWPLQERMQAPASR